MRFLIDLIAAKNWLSYLKASPAIFIWITLHLFVPSTVMAADTPDFYLLFKACSSIIGSNIEKNIPLKTLPGDPATLVCSRNKKKISCDLSFASGSTPVKSNVRDYEVVLETGSILEFEISGGNDYISVNRTTNAAIGITRILEDRFAGAKVCNGYFLTSDEWQALQK